MIRKVKAPLINAVKFCDSAHGTDYTPNIEIFVWFFSLYIAHFFCLYYVRLMIVSDVGCVPWCGSQTVVLSDFISDCKNFSEHIVNHLFHKSNSDKEDTFLRSRVFFINTVLMLLWPRKKFILNISRKSTGFEKNIKTITIEGLVKQ